MNLTMKKRYKAFVNILLFVFLSSCGRSVLVDKDSDANNLPNISNKKYYLFFYLYFDDSIRITYNKKTIFNKKVKTDTRLGYSKDVCVIDTIYKDKKITMKVNNNVYIFKPIYNYSYYFIGKSINIWCQIFFA